MCVALVIQHKMRMRRTIFLSVSCPAVPYFPTLSQKRHSFWKKKLLNIKCVFWFSLQTLPEAFLTLRGIQRDTVIKLRKSSRKERILRLSADLVVGVAYEVNDLIVKTLWFHSYTPPTPEKPTQVTGHPPRKPMDLKSRGKLYCKFQFSVRRLRSLLKYKKKKRLKEMKIKKLL